MKGKAYLVAGILFLLTLAYDLFLWGGLSRTAALGPLVTQGAQREVSLAGIYLPVGRLLLDAVGLGPQARDFAQARFASLEPRLLANPAAAMDTLVSGLPASVRLPYYGAPVLLLLFAVLFWRRPRVVHTIRTR